MQIDEMEIKRKGLLDLLKKELNHNKRMVISVCLFNLVCATPSFPKTILPLLLLQMILVANFYCYSRCMYMYMYVCMYNVHNTLWNLHITMYFSFSLLTSLKYLPTKWCVNFSYMYLLLFFYTFTCAQPTTCILNVHGHICTHLCMFLYSILYQ